MSTHRASHAEDAGLQFGYLFDNIQCGLHGGLLAIEFLDCTGDAMSSRCG